MRASVRFDAIAKQCCSKTGFHFCGTWPRLSMSFSQNRFPLLRDMLYRPQALRVRMRPMGAKHFGARVARLEDKALLTGQANFVGDISLPGMLHACFVRSPHAHARIHSIDASPARAMPGVHAVLTADDLPRPMAERAIPMLVPSPFISIPRTQTLLARKEVCYVGQAIAVVVAENRYAAEDGAAAVN